ncbi:MAG: phosphoribosylanthranilate isomerase [bacterium]|nr:phosphoribosylanthranilate isomerase [bacterium]
MAIIKICGIRSEEDALAALAAGADALGFHVGLTGARAPLESENAAKIIAKLPASVSSVMVTSVVESERLIELARATGAKILQLYGDATPETILQVKKALAVQVWKVLNVADENSIAEAKKYEKAADAIALDTLNKETGVRGGTGRTHDWNISRKIVESISIPVILAGGLNPDNVEEAIKTVNPYAVDVNSGVSNPDGTKDLEKVKLFIERAKRKE